MDQTIGNLFVKSKKTLCSDMRNWSQPFECVIGSNRSLITSLLNMIPDQEP